jgi:RNA methyltransferase, rsmE family
LKDIKLGEIMQQYFLNEELNINSTYELSKDDSNHIVRIMRKQKDDKVYVVFNKEIKYICTIVDNNVDKVLVTPYEQVDGSNELSTKITVAIPPLKNDKIEYLIQKLTELGVSNILLFNSERNIAKIKKDKVDSKLNRWSKIVKEAAEQSKRNLIPDITYVDSLRDLIIFSEKYNHKVVAYEKESVNEDNINLKNLLHSNLNNKDVIAVFGSEGGLSENEINILTENNFDVIGLGKRILRAETAPLYFVSCVAYFSEFK